MERLSRHGVPVLCAVVAVSGQRPGTLGLMSTFLAPGELLCDCLGSSSSVVPRSVVVAVDVLPPKPVLSLYSVAQLCSTPGAAGAESARAVVWCASLPAPAPALALLHLEPAFIASISDRTSVASLSRHHCSLSLPPVSRTCSFLWAKVSIGKPLCKQCGSTQVSFMRCEHVWCVWMCAYLHVYVCRRREARCGETPVPTPSLPTDCSTSARDSEHWLRWAPAT